MSTLSLNLGSADNLYADRFRLGAQIGRGPSNLIFKSWDKTLESNVALKIICLPGLREDAQEEARGRFLTEAARYAELEHEGVAKILAYGEADYEGEPAFYLAMEFARGRTIDRLIFDEERLPEPRALELVAQVCDALGAAHARDIFHGDLKAAHVIALDRAPGIKLIDFELARLHADESEALTRIDTVEELPCHEPPEKLLQGTIDARTDVYSVGVLLYQLITGRRPFAGTRAAEVMLAQLNEEPPLPSTWPEVELSPAAEALILSCLEKEPADRPQDIASLSTLISSLLAGEEPSALRAPPEVPEMSAVDASAPDASPDSEASLAEAPPAAGVRVVEGAGAAPDRGWIVWLLVGVGLLSLALPLALWLL